VDASIVISLASLVLALLVFAATQFGAKRQTTQQYAEQLERRVTALEQQLVACQLKLQETEMENVRLLRMLVKDI
jgi:hypothetical protein